MAYIFKNNAFSTLASSINSTALSFSVNTGHGDRFPVITGGDFTKVTFEDAAGNIEIMRVTARNAASDILTIERAQEGTTARSWGVGTIVDLRLTAASLTDALNHIFDGIDAHDASAISVIATDGITATDVQAALEEIHDIIDLMPTTDYVNNQLALKANISYVDDKSFKAGDKLMFPMATAPLGWVQDTTDSANNRMLRVINTTTAGGGIGGSNSPVLNDVVPTHTHAFTTGVESNDHTHAVGGTEHRHKDGQPSNYNRYGVESAPSSTGKAGTQNYSEAPYTSTDGLPGIYLGGVSATHTHAGTTNSNSAASNWTPRYINMILCAKAA